MFFHQKQTLHLSAPQSSLSNHQYQKIQRSEDPHFVQGGGAIRPPCGFVYKQNSPLTCFVVNTTSPPTTRLFGVWIWLHHNSYVIVTSLYRCHICHIQENVSIGSDLDEVLTRTKLEVDWHFTLYMFLFFARPRFFLKSKKFNLCSYPDATDFLSKAGPRKAASVLESSWDSDLMMVQDVCMYAWFRLNANVLGTDTNIYVFIFQLAPTIGFEFTWEWD